MSNLMNAVRFHAAKNLRFERVPGPDRPGEKEVKVRVEAAGICGSDLHVYETGAYVSHPPVVSGHEFAGVVLEAGEKVEGFKPGDHVVGDSRVFCGQCDFCLKKWGNLCRNLGFIGEVRAGCFAEEIVLPESALVRIAAEVPFHLAALAEPLAVALHALNQAQADPCARTLVLGAGPVGALIYQAAVSQGFNDIHISDVSAYRRSAINHAVPGAAVTELAGAYDLVFDTTGSGKVLGEIVPALMNKKATLVVVGLFRRPIYFEFNNLVESEWNVKGCSAFSSELPNAAVLLEKRWPRFGHVVSHQFPLSDFQKAFDLLLSPEKNAMKIVLLPEEKTQR